MALTHLGVPASDLVLLESIGVVDSTDPLEALAFFRMLPTTGLSDPTGGTFGYTAPPNKALILTEVDWQYASGLPDRSVTLRVFLFWPDPPSGAEDRVFESTIMLGSNGDGGTVTAVTTGVVVPSGVKIAVDVSGSGAAGKIQHVLMRGYLADFVTQRRPLRPHVTLRAKAGRVSTSGKPAGRRRRS